MSNAKWLRLLVAAGVLGAAGSALAMLEEVGTPKALALTATFGTDVPAKTALQQLVPEGWSVFMHRALVLPATLSWPAGQPWTRVVTNLAQRNGWVAKVDWTQQALYLRSAGAEAAGANAGVAVMQAPVPASGEPLRLDIAAGETLRTALERMAQTAGWTVEWAVNRDYKAARAYTVTGDGLRDVLERALGPQGLTVTLYHTERMLRVQAQ